MCQREAKALPCYHTQGIIERLKNRRLYLQGVYSGQTLCISCMPLVLLLTSEDFQAYAQIKAYDVISSGNFKRHLSSSRDNGDKWAVLMYHRHNLVQGKVREIFSLVSQLTTPNSQTIQRVCRDVMSCAQPPIKVLTGHNVCCLTGVNTEHCIDLTRVGKNSKEVFVHPRFWHFFVMLWFCAKLEYVIRACTKQWLETTPVRPTPENYTRLCEEYTAQNMDFNENLFRLFTKGLDYVSLSLSVYRDKYALQPMLAPSDEYMAMADPCGDDGNNPREPRP